MNNRLIMLLMACSLSALFATAGAARARPAGAEGLVSFEFVDDEGHLLETYRAASEEPRTQRAYLEALPQKRYSIRVRNHSDGRIGIVLAVDGRNIVSGVRSELGRREAMYVLGPHEVATYSGWRTSSAEVRRFYFTDLEDSYASRVGDESAIGVIAAAVFEERVARRDRLRAAEIPAPAAAAPELESNDAAREEAGRSSQAGTGFGEREQSRAIRVAFSPARRPIQRAFFKYEWPEQLCARGLRSCGRTNRLWPESGGFVPLPPGEDS